MATDEGLAKIQETSEMLRRITEVGIHLSTEADRRKVLNRILLEARHLARAEAGSLYVLEEGVLRFVCAQNDRVPLDRLNRTLLGAAIPASGGSLAGHVAASGEAVHLADADHPPADAPYRVHRDFDEATGFRAHSILALPLRCPDGATVGVLELFNHTGAKGRVGPFPDSGTSGLASLASMAAMTIHNMVLQDQLRQAHLDTIFRLSVVVELRDNETSDHIRRMSHTSARLARAVGLDSKTVDLIQATSPMHDIGKVVIPDAILHKRGSLTDEEREVVKQHPLMGAQILGEAASDLVGVAHDIALSHHERWDGGGYPKGLAGEAIPLSGRIVGLADVLDALLSKRCYKDACSLDETLDIIRAEDGKHFDPAVTRAFFADADAILESYVTATAAPH